MSFFNNPALIVAVLIMALVALVIAFAPKSGSRTRRLDDRLTDRARHAIDFAIRESRQMDAGGVAVEHVLLGLVRERRGVAARALTNHSVHLQELRKLARRPVDNGKQLLAIDEIVELAARQASSLNHRYIGTEHLLLGVLSPGPANATAAQILESFGVSPKTLRQEVLWLVFGVPQPGVREII